jgi:hypothetical protein
MGLYRPRLFLRVGDTIVHIRHRDWGRGEVVEERHSSLPGGTCLVRAMFSDGEERSFINDLDSELCCYFSGIRLEC